MIKVFSATDRNYASNGDIVIQPMKAVVTKEDNGEFKLDLTCDIRYDSYITENCIITASTPQGDQAFRVRNITKQGNRITLTAKHVFFDSEYYLIADSYVVDKTANDALDHLNMATDTASPFTTISDITTVNSFRCVRKSLYEAIQTVIERWGGHLLRDNWNIALRAKIGADNGVSVMYKKNLKSITADYDWSDVCTKLLPVGKDGILLDELYVYSDKQYEIPYTRTVSFSQDIDEDAYKGADGNLNEEAYNNALKQDLRAQATEYVQENCLPKVNYTLKANPEKITDIGDTIHVYDERIGVDITTNVISYTYDCILNRYTEIQFGNFQQKLSDLQSSTVAEAAKQADENASETVRKATVTLSKELGDAKDRILGMMNNSYVIYDGDQMLVVDALPKEEAHNVMRINAGGIGFSTTGINGDFTSAWTIDGTLNMQAINVINLTADMIKSGTLKLGSKENQSGILEVYDEANTLIAILDKNGLKMYGVNGSYIMINNAIGFAGFNNKGEKIYWVAKEEFHMKKSVVEEEITLCNKMRFIPITIANDDGKIVNDGIGLVSVVD